MQRILFTALVLSATGGLSSAQPLTLDIGGYRASDTAYLAVQSQEYAQGMERTPAPRERHAQVRRMPQPHYDAAPRQGNLGGGFLELLFGGGEQQQTHMPPSRYEPAGPAPLEQVYAPSMEAPPHARGMHPTRVMDPQYLPAEVGYDGREKPGTIIVDTNERFLYLVMEGGTAKRYGIGVGRPGFTWAGVHKVTAKREWPDWRPPEQMLKRQPGLPSFMPGGPNNPLGARALYLGSTLYRIHGSNEPWTIGEAVSSGCIRMRNQDVMDLYNQVGVGAKVVVI